MTRVQNYLNHLFLILTYAILTFTSPCYGMPEPDIAVSGWNHSPISLEGTAPPEWLGNDPVIGRLLCPPVSRVLLDEQRSDGLIFSKVSVSHPDTNQPTWNYHLRTGIYWWDGNEVSPKDLADFYQANITSVVAHISGGTWKVPPHKITASDKIISIKWQDKPSFGPYIWNGVPLYRSRPQTDTNHPYAWECAGIYRPQSTPGSNFNLEPTPGYLSKRVPIVFHPKTTPTEPKIAKRTLHFRMPEEFGVDPSTRPPTKPVQCTNPILTPFVTGILWNPGRTMIQNPEVRKALTMLLPRKTLLESGAGYAGAMLPTLIPKIHPGHPREIQELPFSLVKSSEILTKLGYIRPKGDRERLNKKGKPIELKFATLLPKPGIVEKVIADTFLSIGISVEFFPVQAKIPNTQDFDAVLLGFRLPWPEMNLLPSMHPDSKLALPFTLKKDDTFIAYLEDYARSMTQEQVEPQKIAPIIQFLTETEPVSILMQHRACLIDSKYNKLAPIREQNPDWFRKIISI
ncbi:MAG: ABC transporter substrate-binding protein [Zetaproteobacteria bacterium]|nr:ABC transporter substrate-binding protein [Zetaproteobacteria bacterium]